MEVGAVKQAFNNEIILMKKNLNQARIQVIHKLTRKAKTLAEKKTQEKLKEKFRKKAESAVKEVLIIKKIKAKDLAKFIVTHEGELTKFLNKPEVDQEKACARLLLHKSLQEKYKYIRERFGNTSIQDLFMSRLERRKLKKEAREKQKNKKKAKEASKMVNAEGSWDVEELGDNKNGDVQNKLSINEDEEDENDPSEAEQSDEEVNSCDENEEDNSMSDSQESNNDTTQHNEIEDDDDNSSDSIIAKIDKDITSDKVKLEINTTNREKPVLLNKPSNKKKDVNKNKNFNEKILKRKFNKETNDSPVQEVKIVDPFFITPTGESYMSVVEPRQPDEVKDIHSQGNRKYRRAVMFGHVPKPKERRNDFRQERRFKDLSDTNNQFNNYSRKNNIKSNVNVKEESDKVEKLHPSWEAKKRKSGILPFEGKKIVFDDA
ncbi:serum response factor-binding protein 1 [Battus philenor]|uniref:serum response factor-binding protein 1 n=1 Tax=Battus philenor TaxID=42288 RepID=UPI0035D049AD